ncbi:MAG: hypothetical protein WAR02_03330 [Pseudolabrys sp.]
MNLKLIVGILLITAVPAVAQTQKPNVTKVTKAGAQKVIKTISSDKGKNQT